MKNKALFSLLAVAMIVSLYPSIASAAEQQNAGFRIMDTIVSTFQGNARHWVQYFQSHARSLFFLLAAFGFVLRMWPNLFRLEFGEAMRDLCAYLVNVGFFYSLIWLVLPVRQDYPPLIETILESCIQLGSGAPGQLAASTLSPSSIVGIGLDLVLAAIRSASVWSAGQSTALILAAIGTAIVFVLIAANMCVILVQCWLTAYTGIIYLAFGGFSSTQDIAINYLKSVLAMGIKLMTYTLIIGVGKSILLEACAKVSAPKVVRLASGGSEILPETVTTNTIGQSDILAILAAALLLYILSQAIPDLIAGLISGASVQGMSTAGAAMTAGQTATGAATGMAVSAATNMSGGVGAAANLIRQTSQQSQAGEGIFKNSPVAAGAGGMAGSFAKAMGTDGMRGAAAYGARAAAGLALNAAKGAMTAMGAEGPASMMGKLNSGVQYNMAKDDNARAVANAGGGAGSAVRLGEASEKQPAQGMIAGKPAGAEGKAAPSIPSNAAAGSFHQAVQSAWSNTDTDAASFYKAIQDAWKSGDMAGTTPQKPAEPPILPATPPDLPDAAAKT